MSKLKGKLWLVFSNANKEIGKWELKGESLILLIRNKEFKIESDEDLLTNLNKYLKMLSKKVFKEKIDIEGCLSCKNFGISSMGRDMSRGQRGICNITKKTVEICYHCSKYESK